jgi:hypothetical protein
LELVVAADHLLVVAVAVAVLFIKATRQSLTL